jgi:hypothetical protein
MAAISLLEIFSPANIRGRKRSSIDIYAYTFSVRGVVVFAGARRSKIIKTTSAASERTIKTMYPQAYPEFP